MRNFKRVGLVVTMLLIGGLIGCSENEECEDVDVGCAVDVETCCTASQCSYTVRGQKFNCNGTNCESAAGRAVTAACGASAPDTQARVLIKAAAEAVESRRVTP